MCGSMSCDITCVLTSYNSTFDALGVRYEFVNCGVKSRPGSPDWLAQIDRATLDLMGGNAKSRLPYRFPSTYVGCADSVQPAVDLTFDLRPSRLKKERARFIPQKVSVKSLFTS